jgi:hypothetical protein
MEGLWAEWSGRYQRLALEGGNHESPRHRDFCCNGHLYDEGPSIRQELQDALLLPDARRRQRAATKLQLTLTAAFDIAQEPQQRGVGRATYMPSGFTLQVVPADVLGAFTDGTVVSVMDLIEAMERLTSRHLLESGSTQEPNGGLEIF